MILAPVKLANSSVAFLMRLHKKCFYFLKVLFSEYSIIKISLLEFSGLHYCLFVKVLVSFAYLVCDSLFSLSQLFASVKHFLFFLKSFFLNCFYQNFLRMFSLFVLSVLLSDVFYLITQTKSCQQLFSNFSKYFSKNFFTLKHTLFYTQSNTFWSSAIR